MHFLGLALASIWLTSTAAQGPGLLVHTQQGDVLGTQVTPTVRQFLGIPFAVAGRWEAPKPPARRLSLFRADRFGDSCIQTNSPPNIEFMKLSGGVIPVLNVTESENCLSANVWAPSTNRKQKTAVMVWIYGGGFVFGTSNTPTYDGRFIVRDNDDVTVVTFNYRLNIFGQPNAPQLVNPTSSQNFGLQDIDAAVKWVHDNIGNFGGDPNRIILFGQSAGSAATDAYTFAHPDDTIVKGVIEQSGSISGASNVITTGVITPAAWNNVSNVVGCGSSPDAAQLACMKKVPGRALEDAVVSTNGTFGLIQDNITIFSDTAARAASGRFLKVPLLGGSTQNEGDILTVGAELLSPLGFAPPFVTELAADLQTELGFTCPAGLTAQNRLNAGVTTWRYQYQAVFRDISTRPDLRAWHASELPIVFGTYNQSTEVPKTPEEIALSRYMQSAWVAFARDPQKGLTNFGWPAYNPTTDSLIQIGNFFNRSSATFGRGTDIGFGCAKVQTLAAIAAQVNSLLTP